MRHRAGSGRADARRQELLDPSCFVLLVAHGTEGEILDPALRVASAQGDDIAAVELAPPAAAPDRACYEAELGRASVFLVRTDGYVGLVVGAHSAPTQLAAYRRR